MRWMTLLCLCGLLVCGGCSGSQTPKSESVGAKIGADNFKRRDPNAPIQPAQDAKDVGEFVALQDAQDAPKGVNPPPKANQPRKIRYTSDVKLIVEAFAVAEKGLKEAVKEAEADIAKGEVNSSPDAIRTGVWKIRVPVKHFESFREALFLLGEVEQNRVDSEDMTVAYYDLEAYIENRTKEEVAMNKLLEKAGDRDLDAFLKIKDKRDAIRLDINMHEGRRRLMANLTDFTTVNLTIREKQIRDRATPPVVTPPPPTFGTRASETFSGSWAMFVGFLQTVAIIILAVIPWLPIPLVFAAIVWLAVRYVRGRDAPIDVVVEEAAPSQKT